ncbi:acyl-CoA dehydrogenase family protein [Thermopolyspora sp. NPDC052614]|uniref:acyl-CoA dehydrogenase family protein n=1 Tax=Thermopolyspora sp. NPDC052614 TaxID=3155682 RepID=UPI003429D3E9
MALIDNEDQRALAASVRRLVADRTPLSRVREVIAGDQAYDAEVWQGLVDLGLAGLTIPEEYGGAGGTQADLAAALRVLGAALVPSPLLASTVLAANTLLYLQDEAAKKKWLPRIAEGRAVATLAASEDDGAAWITPPATVASPRGDGYVLNGAKRAVLNAADAAIILVHATDADGEGVYLVEAGADGLGITVEDTIDLTRSTASLTFADTPAVRVEGDASAALDRVADLVNLAVAAEQSGAIKRVLDVTVEYAKIRYSFGQPIGSYQGVKHKLADIYSDWALVDATVRRAVEAIDAGHDDGPAAATSARVLSSPAYLNAGKQMIMLHGGIGFTWEHDAHLYYKNAVGGAALLGCQTYQRRRLADQLGI